VIRALRRPRFLAEWLGSGLLALAVAALAMLALRDARPPHNPRRDRDSDPPAAP